MDGERKNFFPFAKNSFHHHHRDSYSEKKKFFSLISHFFFAYHLKNKTCVCMCRVRSSCGINGKKEKKIFDCHQHAKTELNEEKGFKSYDMKRKKKFNFIEFFTFIYLIYVCCWPKPTTQQFIHWSIIGTAYRNRKNMKIKLIFFFFFFFHILQPEVSYHYFIILI